jgi:hypothetical protein
MTVASRRRKPTSDFEPVVVDRRIYAVLVHLGSRVTALEQIIINQAVPPKRVRKSQSAGNIG